MKNGLKNKICKSAFLSVLFASLLVVPVGCGNEKKPEPKPAEPTDFTETALGVNMRMIYVKGGNFQMGATEEQDFQGERDERAVRNIKMSSYFIGKSEVTQDQWEKVMGYNPSHFTLSKDLPVENVTYEDAKKFCKELSAQSGRDYRLPTEAQWEYAARGGVKNDSTKYSGSNDVDEVAWYFKNSRNSTHEVCKKKPNGLGIHDMSGNVWEWCNDFYERTYDMSQLEDPVGPGTGKKQVIRGGFWSYYPDGCRVSDRGDARPTYRDSHGGFRVVMIMKK